MGCSGSNMPGWWLSRSWDSHSNETKNGFIFRRDRKAFVIPGNGFVLRAINSPGKHLDWAL